MPSNKTCVKSSFPDVAGNLFETIARAGLIGNDVQPAEPLVFVCSGPQGRISAPKAAGPIVLNPLLERRLNLRGQMGRETEGLGIQSHRPSRSYPQQSNNLRSRSLLPGRIAASDTPVPILSRAGPTCTQMFFKLKGSQVYAGCGRCSLLCSSNRCSRLRWEGFASSKSVPQTLHLYQRIRESRRFVILNRDIVEFWAHSFLNTHPIAGSSLNPCLLPATSSLRKTAVSHRFPSAS